MARITVEDCLEKVDNRFELVMLAAKRAHELSHTQARVDRENDKNTVIALREIAAGLVTAEEFEDNAISSFYDYKPPTSYNPRIPPFNRDE